MAQGYDEVLKQGLITDPVIEATLGLAILPFVPFSIVKRTKRGRVVYRKVQAALWKYERKRTTDGTNVSLTFQAARIAKALKVAVVAAYNEATKGDGDEPSDDDPTATAPAA